MLTFLIGLTLFSFIIFVPQMMVKKIKPSSLFFVPQNNFGLSLLPCYYSSENIFFFVLMKPQESPSFLGSLFLSVSSSLRFKIFSIRLTLPPYFECSFLALSFWVGAYRARSLAALAIYCCWQSLRDWQPSVAGLRPYRAKPCKGSFL